MLYGIAILALMQLAALWVCFEVASRFSVLASIVLVLGVAVVSLFLQAITASAILQWQFVALILLAIGCLIWKRKTNWFLPLATTASVLICLGVAFAGQQRWAVLKDRYPLVSLADRLEYETENTAAKSPTVASNDALDAAEASDLQPNLELNRLDGIYEAHDYYARRATYFRAAALRRVHASQVEQFVGSDGFGVGRMEQASPSSIERYRPSPPVPMPQLAAARSDIASAADDVAAGPPPVAPSESILNSMHTGALLDFAQPASFGFVQDREHVAGFEAHGFTKLPELHAPRDTTAWLIQRVELVSLLKHERPLVYQSEFLPKMDELKSAPVRELDAFEQRGLGKLRAGEELAVESGDRQILMLGAIRAATQCLQCHSVERGALLGAFSYELLPEGQRAKATPVDKPAL